MTGSSFRPAAFAAPVPGRLTIERRIEKPCEDHLLPAPKRKREQSAGGALRHALPLPHSQSVADHRI
jgi:hypothetical protein